MNNQIYPARRRSLIQRLSSQWDLRSGRYRAFFPDRKKHLEFCESITKKRPRDNGLFAACEDTHSGEILACLYMEDALSIVGQSEKMTAFNLQSLGEKWLTEMVILSNLTFVNTLEQTKVLQVLLSHCFVEVLKIGGQGLLSDCDIGYFSLYKRLGMRPIGALYKATTSGHFIPMIFHPDEEYLSLINSPVLNILRGINFTTYKELCDWYYKLVRDRSELQIGSAYYSETEREFEGHQTITQGLTPQGRDAFLKKAIVIKCKESEVLITENTGGKSFGFIQKGIVKVVIKDKTVALLSKGDVFGEIGFILNSKRSAQVIAVNSETEVVLFSSRAIDYLEEEVDKTTIWRNLAKVLAQRVVLTNKMLG